MSHPYRHPDVLRRRGPESLTVSEVTARLGAILGHEVTDEEATYASRRAAYPRA